ncbi:alpha/beta fold hydrolase [Gordonia sputi]|uniref:Putative hydrolase n=1 Tax=Gordonia sputi NBRC 100414 TaxID=1089453 RepID=H5TY77_9ACTN|nr:alpha/beta hydrolase [Gordonia sputi]NKY92683.1 alpha/beta hydrolase [Gordonia sputi]GAB38435.1 putative hydrolase [Gordonia sputi NBRC 100414]
MMTHDSLPPASIVTVNGTSIATRTLEPPTASAGDIVLCHGTPWSSQVWTSVATDLSRDYRVFLWDMPGYGESEKSAAVTTDLAAQAVRLGALIELWGLQRPHVVAHDIGGAVALRAHLLNGVEYADVFLWDVVTLDPWGSPFFRLVAENAHVFEQLPAHLHAALVKEYIAAAAFRPLSDEDVEALASQWLGPIGQAAFYRQITALSAADTRPVANRLEATRSPVRIGWGRDDPWIPLRQAYELQSRFPDHPEVVVLDDVGHLTPVEHPSAVTAAVRAWLARQPAPPRRRRVGHGRSRRPSPPSAAQGGRGTAQ